MLATLIVAALICAASILVGEAVARLLGTERWQGWAPAVGLALLLALALAVVKLPGHGTTGAVALGVVVVGSALLVTRSGELPRPPWDVAALTGTTLIATLIPYLSNGRFGIPAVGYTNDPAAHLTWATALRDVPSDQAVTAGYPIGPHSLMAALASGTGIEMEWVFCGLLLALPILIAWAALPLLDGLGPAFRLLAATLAGIAYTVSAFYAQAGFKELLLTLFLLAALGIARAEARRRGVTGIGSGVQVGLLCGATVVSFSYGGLAWPALTAVLWLGAAATLALVRARRRGLPALRRDALVWLRRAAPALIAAAGVTALAVASDAPRLIDSLNLFGASPAGAGSIVSENIGHLAGEVSKREIFGFWPRDDFRFGIEQTLQNDLLSLLAIAVAAYGGLWWLWRRDLAVPAAVAAAVLIAVRLSDTESAYTASKALVPAGALVMVMSMRALLADPPAIRGSGWRWIAFAAAAVFAASALWSSFLVLRGGEVGPRDHADELAGLVPEMEGERVLFLGHDDYAPWELRGAQALVLPTTRPEKRWQYGQPYDFDSVEPATIDAAPFAITTRTAFASEAPPNLRRLRTTPSYVLWQRRGTTPPRQVLPSEGMQPGAVLDCSRRRDRRLSERPGWARVWTSRPRLVGLPPEIGGIPAGERRQTSVFLPAGRWEVSLQLISRQRVHVDLGRGERGSVVPNLERPGPIWRAAELTQPRAGRRRLRLSVEGEPLGAKLGAENHPGSLFAAAFVRTDAPRRLVPLREACGRYVDWYTLGAKRPRV